MCYGTALLAVVAPDLDCLRHYVGDGAVTAAGLCPADLIDDARAVDDLAENGVLVVQPRRRHRGDEELRAVGTRARVRHRQQVGTVEREVRVEFVGELVTGPARTGPERIAALDHEVGD